MGRLIEETGNRYGKLLVVARAENDTVGCARWLCKCDCGGWTITLGSKLRRVKVAGCGCRRAVTSRINGLNNRGDDPLDLKKWMLDGLSSQPCSRCGFEPDDPCQMDFDHLPAFEKLFTLGGSWPRQTMTEILLEINKCNLLCSNCHRLVTKSRRAA